MPSPAVFIALDVQSEYGCGERGGERGRLIQLAIDFKLANAGPNKSKIIIKSEISRRCW